jgi:1-acyl-sn-glycerol-3-phosphate acyltransferase
MIPRTVINFLGFLFGLYTLVAAILAAFVVGVTSILPFAVIPRGRRERYTAVGASAWGRFICRGVLLADLRFHGDIRLKSGEGALVIANHRSWMDPALLIGYTRAMAVSKSSIMYVPFVGLFAWLAGMVFFKRKSRRDRARARDEINMLLRNGHRILLFPEGRRSMDGMHRDQVFLRIPMDCYAAGLPVLPVGLVGTEKVVPPGRFGVFIRQQVHIGFCEPVHPADFDDPESFAEEGWRRVREEVARLEGCRAESKAE